MRSTKASGKVTPHVGLPPSGICGSDIHASSFDQGGRLSYLSLSHVLKRIPDQEVLRLCPKLTVIDRRADGTRYRILMSDKCRL